MGLFEKLFKPRLLLEVATDLNDPEKPVLVLKANGSYSQGSAGKNDAVELERLVREAVASFTIENRQVGHVRIVLDLSDYTYSWGDDFVDVIDVFDLSTRRALVVGPYCRRAISTLMKMDPDTRYDCTEHPSIFLDVGEAINYVRGL
jgi:hypothetical protein